LRDESLASRAGRRRCFVYDAFSRRISRAIGNTTTQFLYDGWNPVQELNGSNGVVANLLTGLRIDEYFTWTYSSNNVSTFLADALGVHPGPREFKRVDLDELHLRTLRRDYGRRLRKRQFVPVHRP
jgi:hypothetical protein